MTYRAQLKQLAKTKGKDIWYNTLMLLNLYNFTEKFYLLYFETDKTVSIAKECAVIEPNVEVGDRCHAKHGKGLVERRALAYGEC